MAALETLPCGRILSKTSKMGEGGKKSRKIEGTLSTLSTLSTMMGRLHAFVAQKKLNHSEAREKILETIVSEVRHFSPQDLLGHLQKRHPEVGKATLYRNLPILVESGIIQEGPMDSEGQTLYELSSEADHHDHIVCKDCKRIFEFHDHSIEKKQEHVSKKLGFTVQDHRHVIYASCDYFDKWKRNCLTRS